MNFECFKITNQSGKLIDVISKTANISKKRAKRIIEEGLVSINGIKNLRYTTTIKEKDIVEFTLNPLLFKKDKPKVIYEDESLLIVNKPPFLNTLKDKPNVESILKKDYPTIKAVHRLDKQTTGVLIFVKNEKIFQKMVRIFKEKRIKKIYKAVIFPSIKKELKINIPIDNKKASTYVKLERNFKESSLVTISIETGRKHQIRKHLSLIGHAVVGEFLYFKRVYPFLLRYSPRIMLHAAAVEFKHPENSKTVKVEAPLWEDFKWFKEIVERGRKALPLKEYT